MTENYKATYCNYDGAYKKGMNDAREERSMDGNVSGVCDPDSKVATEKGYRDGYTTFLKSAPQKVEIINNIGSGPVSSECHYASDCGFSKSCRDRGDGIHLCLGNEPRGGFCEYSGDCGPGLFCRRVEHNIGKCM